MPEERDRLASGAWLKSIIATGLLAMACLALIAGAARAHVVIIHGKAYGIAPSPRTRGLAAPGLRTKPLIVGGKSQEALKYGGGPLMLSSTLYLIFWDPNKELPAEYKDPIIQYAHDLETDDELSTDEFSVTKLYDEAGTPISGKVKFGGMVVDENPFPTETVAGCALGKKCITDAQIQGQILAMIEKEGWPTDAEEKPKAQYLFYTPASVENCIQANECASSETTGFCAYHSQITEIGPEKRVATYSDLPEEKFSFEPFCNSGQAPAGAPDKEADGTLDSEIHEIAESTTDPNGKGWLDEKGEELADKCTYPLAEDISEVYGARLGGNPGAESYTAFNQLIAGHSYYTQQLWSNTPFTTPASAQPAGCIARIGPTPWLSFSPENVTTGAVISFDATKSYDVSQPITSYTWNFGDGSTETTPGPTVKHVYLAPGAFETSLTVSDATGSANASTQTLPITVTGGTVGSPSVSIAAPAEGQTFTVGQVVTTSFSCTETANGPGISSCTDSNGGQRPGGTLDTATAGPHSYKVTAKSYDGLSATATLNYTVDSAPGASAPGTTTTPSPGTGAGTTPPPPAKTAALTRAQKLARALKACQRVPKRKRASCVAQARRRYGTHKKPKRRRHR
jgi:hypothetical protein